MTVIQFKRGKGKGPGRGKGPPGGKNSGGGKGKGRDRLTALLDGDEHFLNRAGAAYVTVLDGERVRHLAVGGREHRNLLLGRVHDRTGSLPGAAQIGDLIGYAEFLASRGERHDTYLRVGIGPDEARYLHLGGDRVVRIEPHRWSVGRMPRGVKLIENATMQALPDPEAGESIDRLRRHVRLAGEGEFKLLAAFMVYALLGVWPFAVMFLMGEAGTAKTHTARIVAALIDPRVGGIRGPAESERDFAVAATNTYLMVTDNVSGTFTDQSDWYARNLSRAGYAIRRAYTDAEEQVFFGGNPTILTTINETVGRADLRDRGFALALAPIPPAERRPEKELWSAFLADRPEILGALLDAVAGALADEPSTVVDGGYERIAEFCQWGAAAERSLGFPKNSIIEALRSNRREGVSASVENDPVAATIRDYLNVRGGNIEGQSPSDILRALDQVVSERLKASRDWPSTPQRMGQALMRAAPILRAIGFACEHRRSNGSRWTIRMPSDSGPVS